MSITINELNSQLNSSSFTVTSSINFQDVIGVISNYYQYLPSAFKNGDIENQAGTNEGSCKIFAYAQLNQLSEQATLNCFGQYYRDEVLKNPSGDDHSNIRNFMKTGWAGIKFDQAPLTLK